MEQNQSAEAAILTQSPSAPAPAAKPLTLIAQADAEIARLREQRHQLAAESHDQHMEVISINERLRVPGLPLAETEALLARRGALRQANSVASSEDERLQRAINEATDRLAALKQERQGYEHLQKQLRGEISDQRVRQRDLLREAELAGQLAEQAEAQLRRVSARLNELGEASASPRFRVTQ